jgi:uncharacterized protein (TIGR00661 family)
MKIMFCIQGEGRGHLTQAIAVRELVEARGHQVVGVVVGVNPKRSLPSFFQASMPLPVSTLPTIEFVYSHHRSVNLPATLGAMLLHLRRHWQTVRQLAARVSDCQPDVVVNFFEPLTALYAATHRKRPPILAIGHQFMFEHPAYLHAPDLRFQQWGMKWFVRLVSLASTRLALSLYEAAHVPEKSLFVGPPILRRQLFQLQPDPDGQYALIYLLNHGYAEQIIRWHEQHPEVELHCFYDKPGAPAEERHDPTLSFHRLDGEKFLRMMAGCRWVVCTAGFESVSEAAYLGKPVFLVPVENHVEQQINALDAVQTGLGITDRSFNLDRLAELPGRLANTAFRNWVQRMEEVLLRAIDHAVCHR